MFSTVSFDSSVVCTEYNPSSFSASALPRTTQSGMTSQPTADTCSITMAERQALVEKINDIAHYWGQNHTEEMATSQVFQIARFLNRNVELMRLPLPVGVPDSVWQKVINATLGRLPKSVQFWNREEETPGVPGCVWQDIMRAPLGRRELEAPFMYRYGLEKALLSLADVLKAGQVDYVPFEEEKYREKLLGNIKRFANLYGVNRFFVNEQDDNESNRSRDSLRSTTAVIGMLGQRDLPPELRIKVLSQLPGHLSKAIAHFRQIKNLTDRGYALAQWLNKYDEPVYRYDSRATSIEVLENRHRKKLLHRVWERLTIAESKAMAPYLHCVYIEGDMIPSLGEEEDNISTEEYLKLCTSMKTLDLCGVNLERLPELPKGLEKLYLFLCKKLLEVDLSKFSELKNLKCGELPSLAHLELDGLNKLEDLDLYNVCFPANGFNGSSYPLLKYVTFERITTDRAITLTNLPKLLSLTVTESNIESLQLANLHRLQDFESKNNTISNLSVRDCPKLTRTS